MRSARPAVRYLEDRDGRSVAYATSGRGPTLVCPAWWVSHVEAQWDMPDVRQFFETLGEHATVVRYDRPGMGLSDPTDEVRHLDDELDLLDRVIAAVGAERLSLLGISCGGPPAIAWARQHPERIERLILYGSYADGPAIAKPEVEDALTSLVLAHWGMGTQALSDVFVPGVSPAQRDEFADLQKAATDAKTAAAFLRLTYEMDVTEQLGEVRVPTFIVHRRKDRAIPYRLGQQLAKRIAGARLFTLEGRLHPPWYGDDARSTIADVLRDLEPAPVSADGIRLDPDNRGLVRDGEPVALTPLEFGLLDHLHKHRGRAVTRDELVARVWDQRTTGSNVVDAVVRTLRRKLGPYAGSVETVKGVGYRFTAWTVDQ